jgi:hypothetical protein
MSKTFKKRPYSYWRRPRGYKQAVINNARKKPPTFWDDKSACNLTYRPWKIATGIIGAGFDYAVCIEKLMKKSAWSYKDSKEVIDFYFDDRLHYMGINEEDVEGSIIIINEYE